MNEGKFLLINFDMTDIVCVPTFGGDDVRLVQLGELAIVDIKNPDAPKWYCSDDPTDPWKDVKTF